MYMDRVSAIKIYYIIININNTNSVIVINCVVILIPGSGCQFMCRTGLGISECVLCLCLVFK